MAAMIVHSQNKTADAKKRYETIVNADPTAAVAANNLAWIYAEEGEKLDEALRLAQSAATKLPENAEVSDTIGWIYYKKELPALAVPAFERSVEKAPGQRFLSLSPRAGALEGRRQHARTRRCSARAEAQARLRRRAEAAVVSVSDHDTRFTVAGWMTRLPGAALLVLVAMALGCTDPEVAKQRYVENGKRLAAEKRYVEAILEYRNALQIDDKFGDARLGLADALAATGNPEGAYREYQRAADLMPDDADVQKKAATVLFMAGQFEDVRTRVEAVLKKNPRDIEAQLLYANALVGLRDLEGGIREIEEAVQLDPQHAATYTNLALLKMAQGQRQAAKDAFEKAVELDPKSIRATACACALRAGHRQRCDGRGVAQTRPRHRLQGPADQSGSCRRLHRDRSRGAGREAAEGGCRGHEIAPRPVRAGRLLHAAQPDQGSPVGARADAQGRRHLRRRADTAGAAGVRPGRPHAAIANAGRRAGAPAQPLGRAAGQGTVADGRGAT